MRCPKCGCQDDKVIDSRSSRDGSVIRRRRECLKCNNRYTTYEEIEKETLYVIKKDGSHQEISRLKIRNGLEKACEKRPVRIEDIDRTTDMIIEELENEFEREVPSSAIGEKVMKYLKTLDQVAYVRFASVYRQFRDVSEFTETVQNLQEQK